MKIMAPTILATGIAIALCASIPARATTFTTGEFVTNTQSDWTDLTAAVLLNAKYHTVYLPESDTLIVGVGLSMFFDSPTAVLNDLPTSGAAAALTMSLSDPTSSPSGVFGGGVTGLALDVDFSAAGLLGTSSTRFGDLLLTGFILKSAFYDLNGMSVSDFLALAETALGGGSTAYSIDDLNTLTGEIGGASESGVASSFATDHARSASHTDPAPRHSPTLRHRSRRVGSARLAQEAEAAALAA